MQHSGSPSSFSHEKRDRDEDVEEPNQKRQRISVLAEETKQHETNDAPEAETIEVPKSIVFVARRNARGQYFFNSEETAFDSVTVDTVLVDTGCNDHLLPLREHQLLDLAQTYTKSNSKWQIFISKNTGERTVVLQIKKNRPHKMKVILPISNTKTASSSRVPTQYSTQYLDNLRFHVCRDDVALLLKLEKEGKIGFVCNSWKFLINNQLLVTPTRRKYALLGQGLISQKGNLLLQFDDICVCLDRNETSWNQIESTLDWIKCHLPRIFESRLNNVEDLDHDGANLGVCYNECYMGEDDE